MKKTDLVLAAIIGFLDGVFFYFILKTAEVEIPYTWSLPFALALLCLAGMYFASAVAAKIRVILQVARFFLVGTLNTFIDLGVLNILIWISGIATGIFYSIFKAVSFLVATINSYFWNKFWTFSASAQGYGGQGKKVSGKEFGKFLIVTTIGLGINVGVASLAVNVIGPQFGLGEKIWASVGAIVAAFFAFVWNFLGSKFIVFRK